MLTKLFNLFLRLMKIEPIEPDEAFTPYDKNYGDTKEELEDRMNRQKARKSKKLTEAMKVGILFAQKCKIAGLEAEITR
jgi:hypothetical protein